MVWVYGNSFGRVGKVLPVNYVLWLERVLGSYFGMTFGVVIVHSIGCSLPSIALLLIETPQCRIFWTVLMVLISEMFILLELFMIRTFKMYLRFSVSYIL